MINYTHEVEFLILRVPIIKFCANPQKYQTFSTHKNSHLKVATCYINQFSCSPYKVHVHMRIKGNLGMTLLVMCD